MCVVQGYKSTLLYLHALSRFFTDKHSGNITIFLSTLVNSIINCLRLFVTGIGAKYPISCSGWKAEGATEDGDYMIDPDGEGGEAPFSVNCTFSSSSGIWTSIGHDLHTFYLDFAETSYENAFTLLLNITYPVTEPQLQALVAKSQNCKMYVKVECYEMLITDHAAWYGASGNRQLLNQSITVGR